MVAFATIRILSLFILGYLMKSNWQIHGLLALAAIWQNAWADVWKCVDSQGSVTYTNSRPSSRTCKLLAMDQPVSTIASPLPRAATPGDFPKVGGGTQRERDASRRQILERELAQEQEQWQLARKRLAEQESLRDADEPNSLRRTEASKPYQDRVAEHQRNIEAIRQELSKIK